MSRRRWLAISAAAVVAVVGLLLFRPDTLFTKVESDEELEEAFDETTTTEATVGQATTTRNADPSSTTTTEVATASTTTITAGPVQVATGRWTGIDHSADGTASIYEQDGAYVLRFEDDTDIQNGPDLYVWLLPAGSYEGGNPAEYIDLGTLKGTVGGQNYKLPPEFDPAIHRAVLIWCLRFAVPFATAPLG
ncbi:MAG: DM13 domain-containing protein [Acidimicrobiia bacterium]